MFNPIDYGPDTLTSTTSITLGYGPNQSAPPRLLNMNITTGGTILLPPISTVLPSPPTTLQPVVGVGDGFLLTIRNQSGNALTVTPYGSSETVNDTLLLNFVGAEENLIAALAAGTWRRIVNPLGAGGIRSVAGAATVAVTDRFLIISTAATVTLPAPSNFPTGVPFVSIINTSGGSVTVTPASGNIQTTAAFTIATLAQITAITDGTNFFLSAQ